MNWENKTYYFSHGCALRATNLIPSEVTKLKPDIKEEYSITQCRSFTLKAEPAEPAESVIVKTG